MNWVVFAVALWLFLGLDYGLRDALQVGSLNIAPYFSMILLVFVSMWAAPRAVVIACLAVGVAYDLMFRVGVSGLDEPLVVLGPQALGALLAGYAALNLRGLVYKKNVLAVAFLATVATALSQIVVVALLTARSLWGDALFGSPVAELGQRLGSAAFTGLVAFVVGPLLAALRRLFAFHADTRSGFRIQ